MSIGRDRSSIVALARRPARWPLPVLFVVQYGLYSLLALSAYDLFGAMSLGVTFFPPAGLTFASFLVLPRRRAPVIALAIVLGELTVDLGKGQGIWWSLGWAAANLSEPLVGSEVARRISSTIELNRRCAAAIVLGGCIIGPAVGASIGATVLRIANDLSWTSSFADVWVGDALGVLVVAPAVLMWTHPRLVSSTPVTAADTALLVVLLAVASVLFWVSDSPAVGYASIPLLAWPALRVGPRGLALAAIALASVSTAATARDRGPWESLAGSDAHTQLGYQQLFLLAAIGGAWLLTLEVRERTRAVERMHTVASDAAVLRRALQAGRMGVWTWDARSNTVRWDEDVERLYGLAPGSFGRTPSAWTDLVHPEDRPRVERALGRALKERGVFRSEHRCVWPDSSVHHVEGIGEVALDADGNVIGAFGVAAGIDERREAEDERARLLEAERRARERADQRAQINDALGYTLDLDELAQRITAAAVPSLAAWCSLVLTLDEHENPILVTSYADPTVAEPAATRRDRVDFDLASSHITARVIRTGRTAYAPEIDAAALREGIPDATQRAQVEPLGVRSSIVVALPGPSGVLGALELARTASYPPFTPDDVSMVEDLARTIGAALNSALLHRRQQRVQRSLDTLQRVTGRLSATESLDAIARAVVEHGSAGVEADSSMLYLVEEHGDLVLREHVGLDHVDVGRWAAIPLEADAPIAEAARTQGIIVLRSIDEMRDRFPEMALPDAPEAALVTLPLVIRDRLVGALLFTFRRARTLLDEELAMLETLAGRCAGAIERAGLFEEQREASLTLQRRLLPQIPETPPWLEVGATYEPATGGQVGGDWYQIVLLDDGRCVAVLGDAVGRGIPAAAAMGQLRAAVAGATAVDADPATVLAATDRLASAGADTRCASLAYALVDPQADEIRYAVAGHPPPLLLRADGSAELLQGARGPLLATVPGATYSSERVTSGPGDTLVLYSDGLFERRGESIDEGLRRLLNEARSLASLPAAAMSDALREAMATGTSVVDDVAVLVVRRTE